MAGGLRISVDDRVAVVTIDRPDALNALNTGLLEELLATLTDLGGDPGIAVIILTGEGERSFIAGADIKEMAGKTPLEARAYSELGQEIAHKLETMRKPTIAAVNGYALGGGCEMALACDVRLASENAEFGQPEINLGIIPGWGGTQRLARVCGLGVAKDLIFTGRLVDAEEALRIGLVNGVHDPVLEKTREVAELLASKGPLALAAAKRALNHALQGDHVGNLECEADEFGGLFGSEDAKEGLTAFAEKRDAHFTGR